MIIYNKSEGYKCRSNLIYEFKDTISLIHRLYQPYNDKELVAKLIVDGIRVVKEGDRMVYLFDRKKVTPTFRQD